MQRSLEPNQRNITRTQVLMYARKCKTLKDKEKKFELNQRRKRVEELNKLRRAIEYSPNAASEWNYSEDFENNEKIQQDQLEIASTLYSISPKAYRYVRHFIYLPSESTIRRKLPTQINERFDDLQDITHIPKIIHDWKCKNSIKAKESIVCVLSVDAIAFSPDVQLKKDGRIYGFDLDHLDVIDTLKLYEDSINMPNMWIDFVKKNWDSILTSGFVYYLQPLDPKIDCIVVHFHIKTNGKATELEKKLLLDNRKIIMKYHISIPSIAADGDSGYNSLHQIYFDSFFSQSTNHNCYLINGRQKKHFNDHMRSSSHAKACEISIIKKVSSYCIIIYFESMYFKATPKINPKS